MNVEAAPGAVEDEVLELALEVGLHLQELEPEHLRVDRYRMIASTGSLRFIDKLVGLRRLLGNGPDGALEDLAFSPGHCEMPARGSVDRGYGVCPRSGSCSYVSRIRDAARHGRVGCAGAREERCGG